MLPSTTFPRGPGGTSTVAMASFLVARICALPNSLRWAARPASLSISHNITLPDGRFLNVTTREVFQQPDLRGDGHDLPRFGPGSRNHNWMLSQAGLHISLLVPAQLQASMSILGMHRISRGEIIGMLAMRGTSGDGEARGELKPLGNTSSVLFGRGGGRPDQLACRRWRADNVPAADPGRSARSRRRNERARPAPRLPKRRMAYPQQVARRTQTVALVAPRHERYWRGGWSP